jgi:putative addiction module killer protein
MASTKLTIRENDSAEGRRFFREWLDSLNAQVRARIQAGVFRFETGNLGDHRFVGKGVWEAKIMFGPGFRLCFGKEDRTIILLIPGGDKSSQTRDIRRAQQLWKEYLERKHDGATHQRLE